MLAFGRAIPPIVFPNPDGALANADRFQHIYLYPGIDLEGTVVDTDAGTENLFFWRSRMMRR